MKMSVKVRDINVKKLMIAYIDQTFAMILFLWLFDHKSQNCSIKLYAVNHIKGPS